MGKKKLDGKATSMTGIRDCDVGGGRGPTTERPIGEMDNQRWINGATLAAEQRERVPKRIFAYKGKSRTTPSGTLPTYPRCPTG